MTRKLITGMILILCMGCISGSVMSQEQAAAPEKEMTAEEMEMIQRWMKYATPGQHHQYLNGMVGSWDLTVKWREEPEAEMQSTTSTARFKWIMDGRFIQEEIEGLFEGKPFQGLGYIGYDNFKEKYFSTWMDNMSTGMMISWGTCDETGKVFKFEGTYDDLMRGEADKKSKSVSRMVDEKNMLGEMWSQDEKGEWYLSMEFIYTRK